MRGGVRRCCRRFGARRWGGGERGSGAGWGRCMCLSACVDGGKGGVGLGEGVPPLRQAVAGHPRGERMQHPPLAARRRPQPAPRAAHNAQAPSPRAAPRRARHQPLAPPGAGSHLRLVGSQAAQALLQLEQHVLHALAAHERAHILDEHRLCDVRRAPGAALACHRGRGGRRWAGTGAVRWAAAVSRRATSRARRRQAGATVVAAPRQKLVNPRAQRGLVRAEAVPGPVRSGARSLVWRGPRRPAAA